MQNRCLSMQLSRFKFQLRPMMCAKADLPVPALMQLLKAVLIILKDQFTTISEMKVCRAIKYVEMKFSFLIYLIVRSGFTVSGPIFQNKLFLFINGEVAPKPQNPEPEETTLGESRINI